jgi:hypothetical protein
MQDCLGLPRFRTQARCRFDKAGTVATYMPDGGWIQIWPFKFYFIGAVCCKLVQTLCEIPWVESKLVESDVHACPTCMRQVPALLLALVWAKPWPQGVRDPVSAVLLGIVAQTSMYQGSFTAVNLRARPCR